MPPGDVAAALGAVRNVKWFHEVLFLQSPALHFITGAALFARPYIGRAGCSFVHFTPAGFPIWPRPNASQPAREEWARRPELARRGALA
jgi:hypothetical protein